MRLWLLFIILFGVFGIQSQTKNERTRDFARSITWFGQSSLKIPFENQLVYIDPYNLSLNDTPDIVFITHSHGDHLDPDQIAKLHSDELVIVAPVTCGEVLKENGFENLVLVNPGDDFELGDLAISVVPAYNVVKKKYHPVENKWVGYVIRSGDISVYHPGDTELIPEMDDVECDIAFMPLGQTYTVNSVEEAVEAIKIIKPLIAIPFHYGIFEGKKEDAQQFKAMLSGSVEVQIKQFELVE